MSFENSEGWLRRSILVVCHGRFPPEVDWESRHIDDLGGAMGILLYAHILCWNQG